jgi:hypothetical protein
MGESENEGGESAKAPSFQAINRKSMAGEGEGTSRSSNAPSREASRSFAAEDNHVGINGRAVSKPSLSRLASPNPSTAGRTPVSDDSAQSGTVTRRASTSSQMSSNHPAAPSYGTRSRNRPGAARPNYTEEDVEMDFEMQQPHENGSHSRADSISGREAAEEDLMDVIAPEKRKAARNEKRVVSRVATNAAKTNGWTSTNTGETTPVADLSSVSASNTSTLPRKRKAAAVATQNITASSQPTPPAAINGKKNGITVTKIAPERETNMVSFEKCNARLNKDGHLMSDDGVAFAPNGMPHSGGLAHSTTLSEPYMHIAAC